MSPHGSRGRVWRVGRCRWALELQLALGLTIWHRLRPLCVELALMWCGVVACFRQVEEARRAFHSATSFSYAFVWCRRVVGQVRRAVLEVVSVVLVAVAVRRRRAR